MLHRHNRWSWNRLRPRLRCDLDDLEANKHDDNMPAERFPHFCAGPQEKSRSNAECLRRLLAHQLLLRHLQPSTSEISPSRPSHYSTAGSSKTDVLHRRACLEEEAVLDAMIDRLILDDMTGQDQ